MSYPTVDECLDRLRRAGWSVGEAGTAGGWTVSGNNGEHVLVAHGRTQSEAWWKACVQARELGMLARARGD